MVKWIAKAKGRNFIFITHQGKEGIKTRTDQHFDKLSCFLDMDSAQKRVRYHPVHQRSRQRLEFPDTGIFFIPMGFSEKNRSFRFGWGPIRQFFAFEGSNTFGAICFNL